MEDNTKIEIADGNVQLVGEEETVEDVFSTYLYTGNGSSQTIENGIDLAGKGGLVWIKSRNTSVSHALFDTEIEKENLNYYNFLQTDNTSATHRANGRSTA